MMRRPLFALIAAAVISVSAFSVDLPSQWRSWRYSRSIPASADAEPIEIALPPDLIVHSRNRLADLRLLDDRGTETPYVLYVENGGETLVRSNPTKIRENSFVPGQFTEVVLEVQTNSLFHNTVKIETPESDFMNWVEIAASDDTHLWRVVKSRAPISRFRKEGLEGSQTIHYSDNSARYLRLRIFEAAHQFPVTAAQVLTYDTREPERATIPANFVFGNSTPSTATQWTADLGTGQLPLMEVSFSSSAPEFYRAVRISASADGKEWETRAGGEIYRYKVSDKLEESLRVSFPESWGPRFWRIEILNGSDAPLTDAVPSLAMVPRYVFFQPVQGRSYRLTYGNAAATAPQYDLQGISARREKPAAARIVAPAAEELTSNYADPRPYTERHPNLLWLALATAVVLLAYSALRALRAPTPPAQ
jgi:hypothetical protein